MKKPLLIVIIVILCQGLFAIVPDTPTEFNSTWYNNHPKVFWNIVADTDSVWYQVWKKKGTESWSLRASIADTFYVDNSEFKWIKPGLPVTIYYKVRSVNADSFSAFTSTESFVCNVAQTDREIQYPSVSINQAPTKYDLYSAYPNPFNMSTTIEFDLPGKTTFSLIIYDINGNEIWSLNNTKHNSYTAGSYSVHWNGIEKSGSPVPSGTYLIVFNSPNYQKTQKINLIK